MIHSPRIDKIDVLRHGDVRQGRLYYLRGKVGREARIRERRRLIRDEGESTEPAAEDASQETEEEART
jgi:large subunit ribosomal protein L19